MSADPAPIYGTLLVPDGAGPHPTLILLPGSGPVDRNGNLPGMVNDSLRLLAEGLAESGVATLRADKRGIGASHAAAPDERALRLDTYVDDTVLWMRALADDLAIARVGLLGHSEGALIATLAAQRAPVDRLVLVAARARRAEPLRRGRLAAQTRPAR